MKIKVDYIKIGASDGGWSDATQKRLKEDVMDLVLKHNRAVEEKDFEEVNLLLHRFYGMVAGLHYAYVFVKWDWERGHFIN